MGQESVLLALVFCSDDAASTEDDEGDPGWTGYQVDNLVVTDNNQDTLFFADADGWPVGGELSHHGGIIETVPQSWRIAQVEDAHSPVHVLAIEPVDAGFHHYFEYNDPIDLTGIDGGETILDLYLKGYWEHPGQLPDEPHWTVLIKPSDSDRWYYGTNPYDDPGG